MQVQRKEAPRKCRKQSREQPVAAAAAASTVTSSPPMVQMEKLRGHLNSILHPTAAGVDAGGGEYLLRACDRDV